MALDLTALELALLSAPATPGAPLIDGIELVGRGYARLQYPPLEPVELARWQNSLPLEWPQAPAPWGTASWIAVLQIGDPTVLICGPLAPAVPVAARDQLRIPLHGLQFGAVQANTRRPYGIGRYSESRYSTYPPAGGVFWVSAVLQYAWQAAPSACQPWTAVPPLVVGGCAA